VAEQLRLWKIGRNESLEAIARTKLDLENRIEAWVLADISIIDANLLVIGRQVQTDYAGYIDLLCMDSNADLVIIELKRGLAPREVTAQALDYASWVKDLSLDRITEIANNYLGDSGPLEAAFLRRFNEELPEAVNENHSILVVASDIDPSTERIMRYLSDTYGVSINAVQFQYYKDSDGQEFLARLFLVEPDTVESQARSKASSKRRRHRTCEERERVAEENGVGDLYRELSAGLAAAFSRQTRASQMAFTANIAGGSKAVFNLLPAKSSRADGLCYQVYSNRLSQVSRIPVNEVKSILPPGAEPWIYYTSAGDDYKGFTGYFKNSEQVRVFLKAVGGPAC
jgi:hypothetical protein